VTSATYQLFAQAMRAALHEGPWRAGESHMQPQSCVDEVEFDVNPDGPYVAKQSD